MNMGGADNASLAAVEARVLDAAKLCCERYGFHKTSIDDVASLAGVSRATVYRLFPGGKDVLFEALRVRELEEFFERLRAAIEGAESLEELLVRSVVAATRDLRADEHLAVMLATEPGEALSQLTTDGLPRILRFATTFLVPFAEPFLTRQQATVVVDVLARLTISYFLAPSDVVDLGDTESARRFLAPLISTLTERELHPEHELQPNWTRPPTELGASMLTDETGHRSDDEILGRSSHDDIEAIVAIVNTDVDAVEHAVKDNAEAMFTWDYTLSRPALRKLYEKGKTGQWNAATDLPWDTEVDFEKVVSEDQSAINAGLSPDHYDGTVVEKWSAREWLEFGMDQRRWTLSQFLHGEQGALLCTAKITESVPWYDAKLYAATQVVDEARHVEVFGRYLQDKIGGEFQVNAHLRMLLDDIIGDSRWDMTYLGMQVMVEGLALAAFGFLHQLTGEPLLKQLLRYVMSDEARHVAFGVLSLREVYEGMTDAELLERQEFAYEAAVRMRDRFLAQEVWERHGVDPKDVVPLVFTDPTRQLFQTMLFSKIVPNCRKLGLLDRNGSWLRHRFEEMGVIQFEHLEDTGEEYAEFAL